MDHRGAQRTLTNGSVLWRIERDGEVLRTAHGARGRPARTTVRVCRSITTAEHAYARAVAAKLDSGYRIAAAPPGWPHTCHPPEAVHDRLEQRLQRDPWAPGLAEVYVTWLAGQHDPRATLGALQHRSAPYCDGSLRAARRFAWLLDRRRQAADTSLPPSWWRHRPRSPVPASIDPRTGRAEAERALLELHRRRFVGGIDDRLDLTWHRGFLDTARLVVDEPYDGDDDENDNEPPTDAELLRRLLRLRSAQLLRALCIDLPESDDGADGDPGEPLELLAGVLHGAPMPALRSFTLGCETGYDDEIDDDFYDHMTARQIAPIVGSLEGLGERFPRLEHLSLAGRNLGLRAWHFPAVRHLELHLACPEEPAVAAFAHADWPALCSLRLGLGNFQRTSDEADVMAVLAPLLTAERMPGLRHLALQHMPDADAICGALARSPTADRLETLELSDSNLSEAGVRQLVRTRHRFTRLRHLDLSHNLLTPADERRLRRAFADVELHTGPQGEPVPGDLDDDEWFESLRLAALGGMPAVPSGLLHSDDDLPDHLDDRFELLLDRVVIEPPTTQDDPRLTDPGTPVDDTH